MERRSDMWIRKFRLELSGSDVSETFTELRMDFRYNEYFAVGALDNMADTFDIDIFNLSTDRYKALISNNEIKAKFFTGYGDESELSLAFEGVVVNVTGRRKIPEHITTVYCIPQGLALANKPVGYKGTKEDKLSSVIEALAGEIGLSVTYEGLDDVKDEPYRGKTIQGNGIATLIELGKQFYFRPRIEGKELRLIAVPQEGTVEKIKTVHTLDAELIRGVPRASVAKLSIPYAFNTKIRTGEVIDTTTVKGSKNNSLTGGIGDPNGITDVSGLGKGSLHYSDTLHKWAIQAKYQIVSATHSGSNYTETYVSNYECVAYIGNQKG
tara:strand:- start:474 stop:1448 length:975 start_codon:yes stop_codon:yes gene_type:complete